MRLRSYLLLLTLAALLPVAIFATVVGNLLVEEQRETFRRGAEERVLALLTAVDVELRGFIETIQALSLTASLADGDLTYFRATAARVLESHPDWSNINLALPNRQRVLDLLAPEGAPLPPITDSGEIADLVQARKPVVSDLALGPVSKRWNFAVRVPVVQDGAVKYVLSAVVRPDPFARLVAAQNLPAGWVAVVLDRNHRIVARTVEPETSRGQLASQSLRDALARAPSGWFRGSTIEGTEVYTPYRRSETTGWTFAMGIPASAVDAAAWRAVGLLGVGLLGTLVLAFGLAHLVGRRISAPIASLASATDAIGRGQRVPVPQTAAIAEVGRLARTLQESVGAMREREERLQLALDAGRMGSWEWNVRTNAVTWSPELEAIHGLAPGSFPGSFEAYQKDIHPDDLEKVQRAIAHSVEHGPEHHVEYRIVRPDGAVRWVEGRGRVFRDESGAPARVVGVCTDITERKRAEDGLRRERERLALALGAGQMGAYDLNMVENVLWWSPETYALFGVAPERFVPTREAFTALVHPEDRELFWRRLEESIAQRQAFVHEFRILPPDGTLRWIANRAQTEYDATGRPVRHFGVALDITERKRIEEALRDADRAKDEFLAMLSHELRNPLAALTAASHVLSVVEPSRDEAIKARAIVERQTKHMARLIADLLDVSRVTLGKLALQRARFNVADAVSSVVDVWRASGRLDTHKVSLAAEPAWVDGDRARIEQIVANLLDNALKFTPAGAAVTVSLRREGAEAVLRVADQGIGLAAEECERVFDLFVQAEGTERAGSGLGIGLALVKQLAELHGGSVSASSEGRDRGAAFVVRLPAVEQPAARDDAPSLRVDGARSILIVEDNDDARQMLQTVLALRGHEVRAARDGKTGLALAAVAPPDVALIDVDLPDMDGYEVARRLRAAPGARRIGLVAVTGFGQAEDQRRALEAGFDAHLVKPVTAERLEQVIAGLR